MQFQLPQNLQQELLAYDPALKKLAKVTKKPTKPKAKYPLGNVPRFIPDGIVTDAQWQDLVDHINAQTAPDRYRYFSRIKIDEKGNSQEFIYFMLYHWESVWYAAWLPPKGQEGNYIYGYGIAYKDTNSTYDKLPHSIRNLPVVDVTKVGRVTFAHYNKCMTADDIYLDDSYKWKPDYYQAWSTKGSEMRPMIDGFRDTLMTTLPTWNDSHNIFQRIKARNIYRALEYRYGGGNTAKDYFSSYKNVDDAVFTADDIYNLIKHSTFEHEYTCSAISEANKIYEIIAKPFFRKWIQARLDEMMEIYNDPDTTTQKEFQAKWNIIWKLFDRINYVCNIWPDCPIDYFQTNLDALLGTTLYPAPRPATQAWLREHMPVASFFNCVQQHYAKWENSRIDDAANFRKSYHYEETYGIYVYSWHEWADTISMLNDLANDGVIKLDPPRRWRITEFHDHVQAEAWKVTHPNHKLPQDLFPEPIKAHGFSFFQPHDTHQLAQWGQAVRNCVGNASHYAEGVRKKQHFIVLAMHEGKPRFTIQLTVNHGVMDVKQIVGISNARLSDEEKEQYTAAFREALTERNKQLQSA